VRLVRYVTLAAGLALSLPAAAETKQILSIPPIQWDHEMATFHPGVVHGPSDVANLTGGITFGMRPSEVDVHLPAPAKNLTWENLPFATEYPEDVRYFWTRFSVAPPPHPADGHCVGAQSYVVFFFRNAHLFRISWRLLPDDACPSPRAAAEDLYAKWLEIDRSVALTTHYAPNQAEVVEATDPAVDELVPIRWDNRKRR
jgi:hypothetical protein